MKQTKSQTNSTATGTRRSESGAAAITMTTLRHFREQDVDGQGHPTPEQMQKALHGMGLAVGVEEVSQELEREEIPRHSQRSPKRSIFSGFLRLTNRLKKVQRMDFGKKKYSRMYMTPEMYDDYRKEYLEFAGEDGQMEVAELSVFFKKYNMEIPIEKLEAIMAEVDYDRSGFLDEHEFMAVIIGINVLKKRRVGPEFNTLDMLRDEGWPVLEMRKLGYEVKHFAQAGYTVDQLFNVFSIKDLNEAGFSVTDLIGCGWDCVEARQLGFELREMLEAGCPIKTIRTAGWKDVADAVQFRLLEVDAGSMKAGGWSLSELKAAGYSAAALRHAGFSRLAVEGVTKIMMREEGRSERKPTWQIQKEVAEMLAPINSNEAKPEALQHKGSGEALRVDVRNPNEDPSNDA